MKLVSVNVGRPVVLETSRGAERTGIYKEPVAGPWMLGPAGLESDFIGWLKGHGPPARAVYLYPADHYPAWQAFLSRAELPYGFFGENLTVEGLSEQACCVGDRLRIGSAELLVTCPRMPCHKFAAKTGSATAGQFMLERFMTGIYCAVTQGGSVDAGDRVDFVQRDSARLSVAAFAAAIRNQGDPAIARKLVEHQAIPDDLRQPLARAAARLSGA
jgi:MOSC domain-containing protein YiiM